MFFIDLSKQNVHLCLSTPMDSFLFCGIFDGEDVPGFSKTSTVSYEIGNLESREGSVP